MALIIPISSLSLAAGWRFEAFYSRLGPCKFIRIMTNTPAQLGLGLTSMCCGLDVNKEQEALCLELLSGLGKTVLMMRRASIA